MADRRLVEAVEVTDAGSHVFTIERSAAGRPGGIAEIAFAPVDAIAALSTTLAVVLPDLRVLDAAIEWADGGPGRGGLGEVRLGGLSMRDADRAILAVRRIRALLDDPSSRPRPAYDGDDVLEMIREALR